MVSSFPTTCTGPLFSNDSDRYKIYCCSRNLISKKSNFEINKGYVASTLVILPGGVRWITDNQISNNKIPISGDLLAINAGLNIVKELGGTSADIILNNSNVYKQLTNQVQENPACRNQFRNIRDTLSTINNTITKLNDSDPNYRSFQCQLLPDRNMILN